MTVARYFPFDPTYSDCFITEIRLNFDRCWDFGISPKYFLRVLSYDTITNRPKDDILEWNLVEMKPCESTVNYIHTIDMRKYNLQIPKGGLLIGIEWIIIDDGTDKIENLVTHHPNVKYFYYDTKMTLGKKRNLMHEKSCGDILVYMDDDDYYPPERISHAVSKLMNDKEYLNQVLQEGKEKAKKQGDRAKIDIPDHARSDQCHLLAQGEIGFRQAAQSNAYGSEAIVGNGVPATHRPAACCCAPPVVDWP